MDEISRWLRAAWREKLTRRPESCGRVETRLGPKRRCCTIRMPCSGGEGFCYDPPFGTARRGSERWLWSKREGVSVMKKRWLIGLGIVLLLMVAAVWLDPTCTLPGVLK